MPRIVERALSPARVMNAPLGFHCDGGGLYLQCTEGKDGKINKSWVFRYAVDGRSRDMGLGPLRTIGLAQAREKARALREKRLDGIDPLEERKNSRAAAAVAAAKAMTFDQCALAYIKAHEVAWRNLKHVGQWRTTISTYASPVFGAVRVREIDTDLVLKVIEPIWTAKPETASRLRGRIESVLDWAKVRGYREGENPARWRGHLKDVLPARAKVRTVKHHPALPYAEIGAFMAELRQQQGASARSLEFVILTAARTGEALGATWGEIDFDARLWTVPGARTKSGREHRVPLSKAAIAVLDAMAPVREGKYLFAGDRPDAPLSNMALLMLLRRMGRTDIVVHGFRATFRTWAAERTSFPREIAEASLAHVVGDETERSYQRGELLQKRRRLMEAWAEFAGKAAPVKTPDVIPFARGRRS